LKASLIWYWVKLNEDFIHSKLNIAAFLINVLNSYIHSMMLSNQIAYIKQWLWKKSIILNIFDKNQLFLSTFSQNVNKMRYHRCIKKSNNIIRTMIQFTPTVHKFYLKKISYSVNLYLFYLSKKDVLLL